MEGGPVLRRRREFRVGGLIGLCKADRGVAAIADAPGREPQAVDTERAIRMAGRALWIGVAGLVLFTLVGMLKGLP